MISPMSMKLDAKLVMEAHIHEIFMSYFKSNARKTLNTDAKNMGLL